MIDGMVVVDKPAGLTSHDVVARCRKIFSQRKVGHAGTLDPDATGLLLVGLGRATRLLGYCTRLSKAYDAEVVCGVRTSTLDESGEVLGRWDMSKVGLDRARTVAATLTGTIEQVPPMVSALKVDGKRLHELARAGIEIQRKARTVVVTRFDIEPAQIEPAQIEPAQIEPAQIEPAFGASGPVFSVHVECSSGTYVRSLAADLGEKLGGGAYLRRLRRSRIGPWGLADAVPLDALGISDVLAPVAALAGMEPVEVPEQLISAVAHGQVLSRRQWNLEGEGPWPLMAPDGRLLAVYEVHRRETAKPAVVLCEA